MDSGVQWVKEFPFVNAYDYPFNVRGDNSTDNSSRIEDAIDATAALNGNRGGVLVLPPGDVLVSEQVVNRQDVIIRGAGRLATRIKAMASFTTSTALVLLGHSSETLTHGCRLENLMLDCNGIANSIGVESSKIQEFSGLFFVDIQGFMSKGIYFHGSSQNYVCDYFTLTANIAANTGSWIGVDIDAGAAIFRRLSNFTSVGPVGGTTGLAGVRIDNYVSGTISDGNIETVADGILVGVTSGGNCLTIANINGQAVTNTVHIANLAATSIECFNIAGNGGTTNAIKDDRNGVTLSAPVPFYSVGSTTPAVSVAIHSTGVLIRGIPTTTSGLASGTLWNDGGTVKVV